MAEENNTRSRRSSPTHPGFDLARGVQRLQEFYDREHFNSVPRSIAIGHWGFSPKGSTGLRCLAAMLHFGLLEKIESNGDALVRVTEIGKTILLAPPERSHEREEALKKAALSPNVYNKVWEQWGPTLPSDPALEYYLIRDLAFNPESISSFLKDFRASIGFAKVGSSGVPSEDATDEPGDDGQTDHHHDLFNQPGEVGLGVRLFSAPQPEGTPMSAQKQPRLPQPESAFPIYSVVTSEGTTIGAIQVKIPLTKEEYEFLEMEFDHRMKVLARMAGVDKEKKTDA